LQVQVLLWSPSKCLEGWLSGLKRRVANPLKVVTPSWGVRIPILPPLNKENSVSLVEQARKIADEANLKKANEERKKRESAEKLGKAEAKKKLAEAFESVPKKMLDAAQNGYSSCSYTLYSMASERPRWVHYFDEPFEAWLKKEKIKFEYHGSYNNGDLDYPAYYDAFYTLSW
jgi:hypothetical protein